MKKLSLETELQGGLFPGDNGLILNSSLLEVNEKPILRLKKQAFSSTLYNIAGSSKGRTSLSESENFGSIPSPAAF